MLFGLPEDSPQGLADALKTSTRLRWVQATAGGAGEQVQAAGLTDEQLSRVLITRAGGVHVGPLAEFAVLGLLAFTKGLPRLLADKAARRWDHYPMAELAGATVLIVGLGAIGIEVARLTKALGMRIIAVNRTGRTDSPYVDEVRTSRFLPDLLPVARGVVLTLPLTDETRGMIDAAAISRMHTGAVLVDVGPGRRRRRTGAGPGAGAGPAGRGRPGRLRRRATAARQPAVGAAQRADQPAHRWPVAAGERADRGPVQREPTAVPRRQRAHQPGGPDPVLLMVVTREKTCHGEQP